MNATFGTRAVWAFLAMFALDLVFAPYIAAVAARDAVPAGLWASAIALCNAFVVVSYVHDRRLIVPVVLGAFAGTWVAVELL